MSDLYDVTVSVMYVYLISAEERCKTAGHHFNSGTTKPYWFVKCLLCVCDESPSTGHKSRSGSRIDLVKN